MRKFDAYGIQESVFRKVLQGREGVVLIKEEDRDLKASIKKWQEEGFVKDVGAGEQRFLPISKMEKKSQNQSKLNL
jgi:hypothetical protein